MKTRLIIVSTLIAGGSSIALADEPKPAAQASVGVGVGVGGAWANASATTDANASGGTSSTGTDASATATAKPEDKKQGKGSFDAGGQVRFPSGPDEMGNYGTFNWVAFDLKGRYFVLDQLTINGTIPLAPIKQDLAGVETSVLGGFLVRPELALGKTLGLGITVGMMKEGAFLLSEKDAPIYVGDLKFGTSIGPWIKIKKFGLDLSATPSIVYQQGAESLTAIQVPVAAAVSLGKALKVAVEAGVYTGDGFKLGATDGGRISLGAAIDVKIGKVIAHVGAGVASLLTSEEMGSAYPTISDSVYVDINAKFAK